MELQQQSTRRTSGDKLILLGAHLNAHPELSDFANVCHRQSGLEVQLSSGKAPLLPVWASTLTEVNWSARDYGKDTDEPYWGIFVRAELVSMPIEVWSTVPLDYAQDAEAIVARVSALTDATTLAGVS